MAIAAAASGGGGRLQLAGHCSCAQTASVPLYMLRCTQQHLKAREARGRASGDRPRGPRRPWIPRRRSRHCPSTVLTIECPCAPLRPLGAPACRRRSTTCSPFNVDVGGGCRGGCSVQGALQACLFRMLVGCLMPAGPWRFPPAPARPQGCLASIHYACRGSYHIWRSSTISAAPAVRCSLRRPRLYRVAPTQ